MIERSNPPKVAVYVSKGSGEYRAPKRTGGANTPNAIAVGRINRDRKLDLVTSGDGPGAHNVVVARGK